MITPIEPAKVLGRDLARWRRLEADVFAQLAEELCEAGHSIDAGTLAWAADEVRRRLMKECGGRTCVSGRLR
jgi:hypothetical protein